ncbi:MAG: hypothetical protein IKU85_06750 [Bacteroidaceae bacterium]|nr:hypothetical protein [Bacteroidaceae bacterium]
MKTMKNILLFILPLLAMLSCSEQMERNISADNKLSTTISVVLPQLTDALSGTRAMSEKADLRTLHLAVFDENGYLLQYVQAENLNEVTDNGETHYTYKVNLELSSSRRIVHFIGNGPESINYGDEIQAIANLYKEKGDKADAYWQRKVLDNGINEETKAQLSGVQLIRNFAWIELTTSQDCENFSIESYYVVNTYDKGSIAPYNTKDGKGWITNYKDNSYDMLTGSNEGYSGFIPNGAELNTKIPEVGNWHSVTSETPYFIYEREMPITDPSYILVKGKYKHAEGNPVTAYYKIDFRKDNGDYFPIIRNFKYSITITHVGHEGYSSPEDAAASSGSGDVSTAQATQSFTNISNDAVRLFVSYTDTTLVYDQTKGMEETEFTLRYKFISFSDTESHNGTEVTINPEGTSIQNGIITSLERDDNDDTDGWREIKMETISIPENTNFEGRQEIVITGEFDGNRLQRKVIVKLCPKYSMDVECVPNEIKEVLGEPFDLVIWVPGGLGSSMFPLDFQIEAKEQSITPIPGDNLPVITGKSIIPEKNEKPAIGFIKQLDYSDYKAAESQASADGKRPVYCHFKSNRAISATNIYVQNEYFYQAKTYLGNYDEKDFTIIGFSKTSLPIATTEKVDFTFSMPGGDKMPDVVMIDLANLEPEPGKNANLSYNSTTKLYEYRHPESTSETVSVTLHLQTITNPTGNTAQVKLSAHQFALASAQLPLTYKRFENISLVPAPGSETLPAGAEVKLSFTMSDMPSGDVKVTLGNLEPTGATRATFENEEYTFKPESKNVELTFKVTEGGKTVSARLSADYFEAVDRVSLEPWENITFTAKIKIGSNKGPTSDTEFTIYADNGCQIQIGTFTGKYQSKSNKTYNCDISVSYQASQAIEDNGGNVYIKDKNGNYRTSMTYNNLKSGKTQTIFN